VTRSTPLVVVFCLQAALLFSALSLLPVWSDELSTLHTEARPIGAIITRVEGDIHPPLYFILLHYWIKLPLPWTGIAAMRAFSAAWALLATLLLDLLLTRSWPPLPQWLALSLFALSPCLLLYGRMARSYSMQMALALVSFAMLRRWMSQPRSLPFAAASFGAVLALLYTHYVPGLAVLGGFALAGWMSTGIARAATFVLAVILGYAPWAVALLRALDRWVRDRGYSSTYLISGNPLVEHAIRIGYGLVSLTIGESFLAVSLALVPVILLLAVAGARASAFPRHFKALLAIAGVIGYLGVARWVSYPFVPARLLWLLPLLSLAVALGISRVRRMAVRWGVTAAILLSYATSYAMYFRQENFLNLGYVAPIPQIAATLNGNAQPQDLIILDIYDTDFQAISALLSNRSPVVAPYPGDFPGLSGPVHAAPTFWMVRNTRDISPGKAITRLQSEACAGRAERDIFLDPYASWERTAMSILQRRPAPAYFYQLTVCGQAAVHPLQAPSR
jgi:hypothetical protein